MRYGGYLAGPIAHCIECHTPQVKGRRDFENQLGAGGFPFAQPNGPPVFSANITPDPETGIGTWSDADIKAAIAKGVDLHGEKLSPPMPYPFFANTSPEDLDAIVAFLRSMKPIRNEVKD